MTSKNQTINLSEQGFEEKSQILETHNALAHIKVRDAFN